MAYWTGRFREHPAQAGRNIRALAAKAPERVAETVIPLLKQDLCADAALLLVNLVGRNGKIFAHLCDPQNSMEDSLDVIQILARYDPFFDAHFARSLLNHEQMSDQACHRGLAVLQRLGGSPRLIPVLIQFLRSRDARIRSKAALILGQLTPTLGLIERLMREQDARVRANFVEGLWDCRAADFRSLFRQALKDPDNRVVGNALVGLHRRGDYRDVMHYVGRMARHPNARVRATAAWVIGQTGDPRYAEVLRHMADDKAPLVKRNALRSLQSMAADAPAT